MKLVEILAKELDVWPDEDVDYGAIKSMSQDCDLMVSYYISADQEWSHTQGGWGIHKYVPLSRFIVSRLADDHATAIVTREMWEAEKGKQLQKEMMSCEPEALHTDIVFPSSVVQVGQLEGPIMYRDTIIHCQAIIEDCEREIEKSTEALAKEGFELIGQHAHIESAEDSHKSMTDWKNWKIGDLVEFVEDAGDYKEGQKAAIIDVEDSDYIESLPVKLALGWPYIESIKWHSRP